MAQLKDLIVNGASRVLGDLFANKIQTNKINAPTATGGSSYGPGSSGQVLKSNGTTVYWGADNNTTYSSKTAVSGGTDVSLVTTGEKSTWNNKASTSTATTTANGLMSSADKSKLDGIASGANAYTLPIASTTTLGGVKAPTASSGTAQITIDSTDGTIKSPLQFTTTSELGTTSTLIPVQYGGTGVSSLTSLATNLKATSSSLGTVKPDGTTITVNSDGVISGASTYTLPTASTSTLGGVKVDGSTITINSNGVISGASTYTLPTASTSTLGGVKVDGTTTTISNGVLSSVGTVDYDDVNELSSGQALGIEYGGTAATTASQARENLGVPYIITSTTDIGVGAALGTGHFYFVYE